VPRLVGAVTRSLFLEDADRHFAALMSYDEGTPLTGEEAP
jgi:hypothetical protein